MSEIQGVPQQFFLWFISQPLLFWTLKVMTFFKNIFPLAVQKMIVWQKIVLVMVKRIVGKKTIVGKKIVDEKKTN